MIKHKSVMLNEAIDVLSIKPNGIYLDLTLGGGGHSLKILESLKNGILISIDVDENNIQKYQDRLKEGFPNTTREKVNDSISLLKIEENKHYVCKSNFSDFPDVLKTLEINEVNGILADLGWSQDQLESIPGLSFDRNEDELDMRLNNELGVKAKDLLNALGKSELSRMFGKYADFNRKEASILSDAIMKRRNFDKVSDLNELISENSGQFVGRLKNIVQTKARIFQALRIAVNDEYTNLTDMLSMALDYLSPNGILVVISFHSGEERLIEDLSKAAISENEFSYITKDKNNFYLRPSFEELKENLYSRSAKLWGLQKN